ncbi:MAG: hypothetical protein ACM3UO_00290 [Bacillota bacterium]
MSRHKDEREPVVTMVGVLPSEMSEAHHEHIVVGTQFFPQNLLDLYEPLVVTEKCPACFPAIYAAHYSRHNNLNYSAEGLN